MPAQLQPPTWQPPMPLARPLLTASPDTLCPALRRVVYPREGRFIGTVRIYNTADKQGGPFSPDSLPSVWNLLAWVSRTAV